VRNRGALAIALALVMLALPAGAAAQGDLDAHCDGPREMSFASMGGGDSRVAQTFTAQTTGSLTAASVDITKQGTAGDYRLSVNEVDGAGVPTNNVLALTTIADASVPAGSSQIEGTFAFPAQVTAGQLYALVLTRPGSTGLGWGTRVDNDCPGGMYFSNTPTGPFSFLGVSYDVVFAVFVLESTPPETRIARGPKEKTRKRRATFEFTATDARAVAGFECSLDGGAFAACTSPHTVKVKRGKHTFSVRAADQAGNVDASPATYDWKVKKKRKRR
jgi:hypothetical protein